jgi:hypothetical protein
LSWEMLVGFKLLICRPKRRSMVKDSTGGCLDICFGSISINRLYLRFFQSEVMAEDTKKLHVGNLGWT